MTSAARIAANRVNAQKSSGPRTAAGKARAAQNARRHGLSRPAADDPAWAGEIAALARKIAGEGAGAERLALAFAIAAAQIEVKRTRQVRGELICALWGCFERGSATPSPPPSPQVGRGSPTECVAPVCVNFAEGIRRLAAIDDYEQRALARRKVAIRAFDAAQLRKTNPIVECTPKVRQG